MVSLPIIFLFRHTVTSLTATIIRLKVKFLENTGQAWLISRKVLWLEERTSNNQWMEWQTVLPPWPSMEMSMIYQTLFQELLDSYSVYNLNKIQLKILNSVNALSLEFKLSISSTSWWMISTMLLKKTSGSTLLLTMASINLLMVLLSTSNIKFKIKLYFFRYCNGQ